MERQKILFGFFSLTTSTIAFFLVPNVFSLSNHHSYLNASPGLKCVARQSGGWIITVEIATVSRNAMSI